METLFCKNKSKCEHLTCKAVKANSQSEKQKNSQSENQKANSQSEKPIRSVTLITQNI